MYSVKELCALYHVSEETLVKYLRQVGVFSNNDRRGKGHKPKIGHMQLQPFFRVYGDRTGYHSSTVMAGQMNLFAQ